MLSGLACLSFPSLHWYHIFFCKEHRNFEHIHYTSLCRSYLQQMISEHDKWILISCGLVDQPKSALPLLILLPFFYMYMMHTANFAWVYIHGVDHWVVATIFFLPIKMIYGIWLSENLAQDIVSKIVGASKIIGKAVCVLSVLGVIQEANLLHSAVILNHKVQTFSPLE